MLKKTKTICLLTLMSPLSYAALFIEPSLGYSVGSNLKINNFSYEGEGITDNGDYSGGTGLGFGLSAGFKKLGLYTGLNYLNRTVSFSNDSISSSSRSSLTEIGLLAGYQLPLFFKFYLGYNFSSSASIYHRSGKLEMNNGTSTFYGIGLTSIPFININLEYHKGKFAEQINGSLISGKKTNYDFVYVSVSVPLTFLNK